MGSFWIGRTECLNRYLMNSIVFLPFLNRRKKISFHFSWQHTYTIHTLQTKFPFSHSVLNNNNNWIQTWVKFLLFMNKQSRFLEYPNCNSFMIAVTFKIQNEQFFAMCSYFGNELALTDQNKSESSHVLHLIWIIWFDTGKAIFPFDHHFINYVGQSRTPHTNISISFFFYNSFDLVGA